MDSAKIVERILTGFVEGHAQLDATLVALKASCDDVPLPHRDGFFTHLLLHLYREALAGSQVQCIIPILHAWAKFGPADTLPSYVYGVRGFGRAPVEQWAHAVLPVFRFVLGSYADRFSDDAIGVVLNDCAALRHAEPLLGQAPFAEETLKNVQALADTAQYIRHQRFLRTIAHPKSPQQTKEYDDRLPLYRRRVFDEDIERESRTASAKTPLTVMMLDLDHFKAVNDTHGHLIGDDVLLECAQLVVQAVQGKGIAYRYGGEEFTALLPNSTIAEGLALAERIRSLVEQTLLTTKQLPLTVSIGVATVPTHASRAKDLLAAADRALYQAKHKGRNRACVAARAAGPPVV